MELGRELCDLELLAFERCCDAQRELVGGGVKGSVLEELDAERRFPGSR